MRRLRVGDVFCFQAERGYRLIQLAYKVERKGSYYRVFPGFYPEIPRDPERIVSGDCSYMVWFNVTAPFRAGLFRWLGTFADSITEPFPKYDIQYHDLGGTGRFEVCEVDRHQNFEAFDGYPDGRGLPEKYRDVKLINALLPSTWLIYLLSSDFDRSHWDLFWPGEKLEPIRQRYGELVGEGR